MDSSGIPFSHSFGISTGGRDVIHSGSAMTFGGADIEFSFDWDGGGMKVIFKFLRVEGSKGFRINVKSEGDSTLLITMENMPALSWIGSNGPVRIGYLGSRELFLQYKVKAFYPDREKIVRYTFYLGADSKGVEDDQ